MPNVTNLPIQQKVRPPLNLKGIFPYQMQWVYRYTELFCESNVHKATFIVSNNLSKAFRNTPQLCTLLCVWKTNDRHIDKHDIEHSNLGRRPTNAHG